MYFARRSERLSDPVLIWPGSLVHAGFGAGRILHFTGAMAENDLIVAKLGQLHGTERLDKRTVQQRGLRSCLAAGRLDCQNFRSRRNSTFQNAASSRFTLPRPLPACPRRATRSSLTKATASASARKWSAIRAERTLDTHSFGNRFLSWNLTDTRFSVPPETSGKAPLHRSP